MPYYQREGARIYYELHGSGYPLLLIAPGGMKSAIPLWANAPWNPVEVLAREYCVVAMDQRNAGRSSGPVSVGDGWSTYTADQLGLMAHLGFERFHTAGMCIGGSYCLGLADAAPARISAAVLFQPIGLDDNRDAFYQMFDNWADALRADSHSAVPEAVWLAMRGNMYDGDLVFNLDAAAVARIVTPVLILRGNDLYHPASTSEQLAALLPNASLVEEWKSGPAVAAGQAAVLNFLAQATPAG